MSSVVHVIQRRTFFDDKARAPFGILAEEFNSAGSLHGVNSPEGPRLTASTSVANAGPQPGCTISDYDAAPQNHP